jgi:hypothetical protein
LEIVNKVAQSGIVSIDLEELFPAEPIAVFDLKDYLFRGLILREKDFREALAATDWSQYTNKYLTVDCSADAIIPNWAYMLVAAYAQPFAIEVMMGNTETALKKIYAEKISKIDPEQYRGQRIVVKGCSDKPVPVDAYLDITRLLKPVAKSIMYGEPCSTVPIYKKTN